MLEELLSHHEDRLGKCLDAVRKGASSGYAVASCLTWTSRGLSLDAMDTFNRMLAVRETLAHLDVLVLLGELQVNSTSDVAHYELPTGHAGSAPLRLVDRISN